MAKLINMHPGIDITGAVKAVISLDFSKAFADQVKGYVETNIASLSDCKKVGMVGQSVGAILLLPAMEMIAGLPEIALYQPGTRTILGFLNTADYRHQIVRPRRTDLPQADAYDGITVLDGGGRGLTPRQKTQIAERFEVGEDRIRVLNLGMGQVDMADPTAGVVEKVLASGFTAGDARHPERLVYVPAGAGLVGALMALTIYGLTETWPQTVRLNKEGDEFIIAEIVQPQDMRQFGVQVAARFREGHAPVPVSRELFSRMVDVLDGLLAADAQIHARVVSGPRDPDADPDPDSDRRLRLERGQATLDQLRALVEKKS